MAIAFVRKWTPVAQPSGSTVVATGTASVSGNTLIACIQHQSGDITSVTDSAGNTWHEADDTYDEAGVTSQRRVAIWYCIGATSTGTVTANMAVSGSQRIAVSEWSGIGTLRGAAAGVQSTSTTPPGVPVTGVLTGDLVVGAIGYNEAVAGTRLDTLITSGTGYTELDSFDNGAAPRMSIASSIRSGGGSTSPTWSMSSGTTAQVTAAFVPGSSNTAPTLTCDGDLAVDPWQTVSTSCIANDPDETLPNANYVCTQTAGPTVTLSGTGNSRSIVGGAPVVVGGTVLTFEWHVVDSAGADSNHDSQTITVYGPVNFHNRTGSWQPMRIQSMA